jgi:hypothetical protein
MPEQTLRSAPGEITPFDIADWFWSFRWLAVSLLLCATVWTAVLFWAARDSNSNSQQSYELIIGLYSSGTPVRSVSAIADIYGARLVSTGLSLASTAGSNPVVLRANSQNEAEVAAVEADQIADQLVADVRSQVNSLAAYMQREDVPEFIAGQYVRNISFLDGVETGLIEVSRTTVREVISPSSGLGIRVALPWIACGVIFFVLAGAVTFVSKWKAYRRQG